MTPGGLLILLFFVVGIIAIIFKWKKEDSDAAIPPKPPAPDVAPIPVADPEKKTDFVTVYQMHPITNVKICRFCDGENPMGVHICGICGEEIDA